MTGYPGNRALQRGGGLTTGYNPHEHWRNTRERGTDRAGHIPRGFQPTRRGGGISAEPPTSFTAVSAHARASQGHPESQVLWYCPGIASDTKNLMLRLPPDLHRELSLRATVDGRSMNQIVVGAVRESLHPQARPVESQAEWGTQIEELDQRLTRIEEMANGHNG